jgi:hypothetical protein
MNRLPATPSTPYMPPEDHSAPASVLVPWHYPSPAMKARVTLAPVPSRDQPRDDIADLRSGDRDGIVIRAPPPWSLQIRILGPALRGSPGRLDRRLRHIPCMSHAGKTDPEAGLSAWELAPSKLVSGLTCDGT